ncbi:origin recognition complex subunit 4 C-terminus-domain-containing protein [Abortiporus biennis]|nr:origin recognition complex subunit 4 C-terminus-domain-containing protein [Abortiporus biennis]
MTASRALSAEETDTTEFEDFPTRIPFTNSQINTPAPSPTKSIRTAPNSPSKRGTTLLPDHLHPHFHAQKTAILKRIRILTPSHSDDETVNSIAFSQLNDLMQGSVMRGEGNSCLLIGPRGSGKSKLVEEVISSLPTKPIVVRLSGHAQTNDRLAMREIAFQLMQQTGMSFMNPEEEAAAAEEADNPFIEHPSAQVTALPPPAHLLALISMIPTLGRPTVIVLDAFELFADHARQSLLYCLFDTVQHSKVSSGSKGMAVIGVTARVDAINLLEKRVKSRFSGRMFRTACPQDMEDWMQTIRSALVIAPGMEEDEWTSTWEEEVDIFLQDEKVVTAISETYALTRDMRTLSRILTSFILNLSPSLPIFPPGQFVTSVESHRAPSRSHYLNVLPYPGLCLLIASVHTQIAGHADFTFEMLCEAFYEQLKTSASAPVNIEGGGLGMVRCSRDQLLGAMERLVSFRAFKPAASIATGTTKEFVRYRCTIDRKSIKDAVDRSGQLHLRRWLGKPAN